MKNIFILNLEVQAVQQLTPRNQSDFRMKNRILLIQAATRQLYRVEHKKTLFIRWFSIDQEERDHLLMIKK